MLTTPVWQCGFDSDYMAFTCASESENQEFGFTFSPEALALLGNWDFQTDFVDNDDELNGSVSCEDDGGGSYSCSFAMPNREGDCSLDVSFDESHMTYGGDLSGDISLSCSYDNIK